jgi:hypothetical protein
VLAARTPAASIASNIEGVFNRPRELKRSDKNGENSHRSIMRCAAGTILRHPSHQLFEELAHPIGVSLPGDARLPTDLGKQGY